MTFTLRWLRIDARRRWRSFVVLALVVALSTGTVLAAFAGARGEDSAIERLRALTLGAQATLVAPGFDWDLVRGMPGVEGARGAAGVGDDATRQTCTVVGTQAAVLVMGGPAFGVPLGLALGRTVWRQVAGAVPIAYHPPVPVATLLLIAPVALFAAGLLAAWPARRAARMRVADVLRAE